MALEWTLRICDWSKVSRNEQLIYILESFLLVLPKSNFRINLTKEMVVLCQSLCAVHVNERQGKRWGFFGIIDADWLVDVSLEIYLSNFSLFYFLVLECLMNFWWVKNWPLRSINEISPLVDENVYLMQVLMLATLFLALRIKS